MCEPERRGGARLTAYFSHDLCLGTWQHQTDISTGSKIKFISEVVFKSLYSQLNVDGNLDDISLVQNVFLELHSVRALS